MLLPGNYHLPFATAQQIIASYHPAIVNIYDHGNAGHHDIITPADVTSIAALNAFNQGSSARALANLWVAKVGVEALVPPVPVVPLVNMTAEQRAQSAAALAALLDHIDAITGWGPVMASKLAHRLRPEAAPIWDQYAGEAWHGAEISWQNWIMATYDHILAPGNLAELQTLQHHDVPAAFGGPLSLVRIWDILLWWEGQP